jgi:hypothetical protein
MACAHGFVEFVEDFLPAALVVPVEDGAWFTTMQDRMRRERSRSASGPVTLLGKGSIYLLTMPAHTGDHTKKDAATRSS